MSRRPARITIPDILLIAGLIGLPVWSLSVALQGGPGKPTAYVYQRGKLFGVYPLDRDRSIVIGAAAQPDMIVEIKAGRIRVAESDCAKGVCKHTGWVSGPGRPIVCVPNKVLIEVKGGKAGSAVDAESY